MISILVVLLFACDQGPDRTPAGWDDTAENCPYWTLAPAGEDWEYLYACDPCGVVYGARVLADGDEVYWGGVGDLRCSCIDENHQWKQEDPDCQPNY